MDAPFSFNQFENKQNSPQSLKHCNRDNNSSFESLLKKSGTVIIHHGNLQLLAVETFKAHNNLSPSIMSELFEIKDMKYELRNGMNLRLNLPRTSTYGIDSLHNLSANIWTHVLLEIKQCKSLNLFKQNIKKWILTIFF